MDEKLAQNEIEKLLQQAQGDSDDAAEAPPVPDVGKAAQATQSDVDDMMKHVAPAQDKSAKSSMELPGIAQGDIDMLLQQAQSALASIDEPEKNDAPGVVPFKLQDFSGEPASSERATIELVNDVELNLQIELGRTRMYLEDILKLQKGSVVSLNKLAGDPVDVYINGRLVARGEVLVLNDNFCVRVAELIAGDAVG